MAILTKSKHKERIISSVKFNQRSLKFEILREAKVVKLPMGMAELIAEKIADRIAKWLNKRGEVTATEFKNQLVKVTKEYNPDLAFILKNRDRMF